MSETLKKAGPYPGNLDQIKILAFGYDDYDVLCLDTLGKFMISFSCDGIDIIFRVGIDRWSNTNEYPRRLYIMGLGRDQR